MVDDVRMIPPEDVLHPLFVADGADQHHQIQVPVGPPQLLLDVVGVVLIDVEDNQAAGVVGGNLAAQLAADGAAAAGDQDRLALDVAGDLVQIDLDAVAAQQVLDLHIADLLNVHAARGNVRQGRDHLGLTAGLLADFENLALLLRRRRGDGEDDLLDVVAVGHLADVRPGANDGNAADGAADLLTVVVDEADHAVAGGLAAVQVIQNHGARRSCADNHRSGPVPAADAALEHLPDHPVAEADGKHHGHQQQGMDQRKAPGQVHPQQFHGDILQGGQKQHRRRDMESLLHAGKGPETVVQPQERENRQHHHRRRRQEADDRRQEAGLLQRRQIEFKANKQRKKLADRQSKEIRQNQEQDAHRLFGAEHRAYFLHGYTSDHLFQKRDDFPTMCPVTTAPLYFSFQKKARL